MKKKINCINWCVHDAHDVSLHSFSVDNCHMQTVSTCRYHPSNDSPIGLTRIWHRCRICTLHSLCICVCVYGLSFQGVIAWTGYNYMNWVKRWPIPCWLSFYLLHSNLAKKVVNIFLLCSLSPCRLPLNARLTKPFAQQHRRWFHFHQVFWDDRRNNVHGDNTEANKNLGELRAIVRYKNTYYTSRMLSYRSFARC